MRKTRYGITVTHLEYILISVGAFLFPIIFLLVWAGQ